MLGSSGKARRERKSPEPYGFRHLYCNTQQVGNERGAIDNMAQAADYSLRGLRDELGWEWRQGVLQLTLFKSKGLIEEQLGFLVYLRAFMEVVNCEDKASTG